MSQIKNYKTIPKNGKKLDKSMVSDFNFENAGVHLTGVSKIVVIGDKNQMSSSNLNMIGKRRVHEDGDFMLNELNVNFNAKK